MEAKKIILSIDDNVVQHRLFNEMLVPNIEMPNINGVEFLKDIREIPSYIDKPIIIVSANSGEEFYKWARNSSASDVLTKPVTEEMLVKTIEKAFAESV
jgi:CheY-like chemotaxis protein